MNRTINFRAFHKTRKEMVYLREMDATCAEGAHIMFGFEEYGHEFYNELDMNQWELMQFTGLKDRNGKDLYEGDIVQYQANHPKRQGEVFNNYIDYYSGNTYAGFRLRNGRFALALTRNRLINGGAEIIGNIYENPELLTPPPSQP